MKEKPFLTILGISFFIGTIDESLDLAKKGGLVVMPSGPNLADLPFEPEYQEAVMKSDLVLLDSGSAINTCANNHGLRGPDRQF